MHVIDYVAEAEMAKHLPAALQKFAIGIPERIEIDQMIFGGESSASQIAAHVGVTARSVQRRRAVLRARGYALRAPVTSDDPFDQALAAREGRRAR